MKENNARQLLRSMGMGDFNATIAIQYMFVAPAQTDPAMPSIMLMTKHLQQGLRAAGAQDVAVTGKIDNQTAAALERLSGPDWHQVTWYSLFQNVLAAKKRKTLETSSTELDLGIVPSLPSVPGGMITWGAAAFAAWYFLFRKKGG